ncbi:MAG: hypothetical protein V3V61_00245 [Gammaproteobacteria bacterium]
MATSKGYTQTKAIEQEVFCRNISCDSCDDIFMKTVVDEGDAVAVYAVKSDGGEEIIKGRIGGSLEVSGDIFDLCPKCTNDIIDKYGLKQDK